MIDRISEFNTHSGLLSIILHFALLKILVADCFVAPITRNTGICYTVYLTLVFATDFTCVLVLG
jgi:hypothetical protein